MANVLFSKMSAAKFATITPDNGTFYRVTKSGGAQDLYLGTQKLNNADDITAAIGALTADDIAYDEGSVKDTLDTLLGDNTTSGSIAKMIKDAIDALDGTATIASKSGNVVTIKGGIAQVDGSIDNDSSTDIVLEEVASTGAAADVSVADKGGNYDATDVEGVLAEIAENLGDGVDGKTVHLADESAGQSDYAKVYKLYQGADASDNTNNTLVGTINIPKDKVVQSGKVVTIEDDQDSDGDTTSGLDDGTYIKIVLQNVAAPLYINATSLVDIYTAAQNATQVQVAVVNGVISATIVAGSITATELAANAVTTEKIQNDAVTADKVAIAEHAETQTAGADGLALSVKTTDGQVSEVSGSIAANTYDAYGDAAKALSDAIGKSTDAASADTINGAKAYANGVADDAVAEVIGENTDAASADTIHGAKAYGDAAVNSAKSDVIGKSTDAASADTVNGAKAYADGAVDTALTWVEVADTPAAGD